MASPTISRHSCSDPPDIGALIAAADSEGHPFVSKTLDEWLSGENRFDAAGEAFFVASVAGEIVGMCGINIDPHLGDPEVARLRHLYVHPDHRSDGLGAELVAHCLSHAWARFNLVRLRTPGEAADRFYDNLGFDRSASDTATHEMTRPSADQ